MKKVLIYILCSFVVTIVTAQQTPLYSLYKFNDFIVNPAIAGSNDYFLAQVNNRYQFVGIENAPVTATLSLHGRLSSQPMGLGGIIYNDSQGAFSKFGVYGAYSYILEIDKRTDLAFGLNAGVIQYKVDMTKIKFLEEEPNLNESLYKYIRPDATFGVYLKSRDYFVGVSADQLFNNKIEMVDDSLILDNSAINRITSHVSAVAGFKYELSYGFRFEPSVVIRKAAKVPPQLELTGCISYNKTVWAGVSFRTSDAVAIILGYNYRKLLNFAYAYDITYSTLRKASNGSHEVMVGIKFNEK